MGEARWPAARQHNNEPDGYRSFPFGSRRRPGQLLSAFLPPSARARFRSLPLPSAHLYNTAHTYTHPVHHRQHRSA
jgi:hypothetical protein